MPVLAKEHHLAAVNRAIDFIVQHPAESLDLEQIASVAHVSSFHFHRIFKAIVGETLASFVKRVRLQRAVQQMSHCPSMSLTEIAISCGFSSSSDFSRSFKQRYGVPPRAFDTAAFRDARREGFVLPRRPPGENPDGFGVVLRDIPPRAVAYIRVLEPFRPNVAEEAASRLVCWARQRGCAGGRWLGYMWDDPEVVPLQQCRYDVGVEIDKPILPEGEVGCIVLPAMKVAEVSIAGGIDLEQRALDWLYGTWLPSSRYLPDHQPCFEVWRGEPFAHGTERFELDVQLPVTEVAGTY